MNNQFKLIRKDIHIQRVLSIVSLCIMMTILRYEPSSALDMSESQKLMAFGGCVNLFDGFGTSVVMDSDTMVVGAPGNHTFQPLGSVYIIQWNGSAWTLQQKITASDGKPGDRFGKSLSLQDNTLVTGSGGAAYVYGWDGTAWTEQQKLTPSEVSSDNFGDSVSLYGNTIAVSDTIDTYVFQKEDSQWVKRQKINFGGMAFVGDDHRIFIGSKEDSNDNGEHAGAVYVFTWNGVIWVEQQKLIASDGAAGNGFGRSLTMDENTFLVGSSTGNSFEGAVYVFKWNGNSWLEEQKIIAHGAVSGTGFNDFSMAVNGNTMVIGAEYDGDSGTGAAYVYGWDGTAWSQEKIIRASDGAKYDHFGDSLAIFGDTIIIGAPQPWVREDDFINVGNGMAYRFQREASSWIQNEKFLPDCHAPSHCFGRAVAIDGDTLVVGGDDGSNEGRAWVFCKNGLNWIPRQKLYASDPLQTQIKGDQFGGTVAIDGDTILIGSIQAEAAYVFKWDGASWNEQQKLMTPGYHGEALAIDGKTIVLGGVYAGGAYVFQWDGTSWTEQTKLNRAGGAVAIDGNTILAGDVWDTSDSGDWTGAVYVYQWDGSAWVEQAKLTASDGGYHHRFGGAVAIDGDTIIIAISPYGDARAVYMFKFQDGSWTEQAKLTSFGSLPFDYNKPSIDIDSDTIIVGADGFGTLDHPGAAYVFHQNGMEQFRLLSLDGMIGDSFGKSTRVDGDIFIIGADGYDSEIQDDAGAVYVFDLSENNTIPFDLIHALLILRSVSGSLSTQPISIITDINIDGKIGLPEAVHLLQEISNRSAGF